jgi:hypothetical protein
MDASTGRGKKNTLAGKKDLEVKGNRRYTQQDKTRADNEDGMALPSFPYPIFTYIWWITMKRETKRGHARQPTKNPEAPEITRTIAPRSNPQPFCSTLQNPKR